MDIQIETRCDGITWPEEVIRELTTFALEAEEAPENCEISISLVGLEEMTQLNERYRGKQGPTDVLSFPIDDVWDFPEDVESAPMLGDIVIAPEVAAKQAPEYGNSFDEEMSLLLVHGILHLLGYDHIDDTEAEEMEAREREILGEWKVKYHA
ncbi:MAG: rRNA maturation RNase YbeY [Coriobacteriales bacterium]|nr:rRNA maturation RNase YbeY [Coriobacteriales bacterium]